MSGPIEFTIAMELSRRAQIQARLEEQRRLRAEQTRERLAANRLAAQRRVTAIQNALAARNQESLERSREQARREAQERQSSAMRAAASQGKQHAAPPKAVDAQFQTQLEDARQTLADLRQKIGEGAAPKAVAPLEQELGMLAEGSLAPAEARRRLEVLLQTARQAETQAKEQMEQLTKELEQISQWRDTLPALEAVGQFQQAAAANWIQQTDALLAQYASGLSVQDGLSQARRLSTEADKIVADAEALRAKFETRNILLRDVIDSLKGIGFFVADPEFQRPDDPTSPVLLKAVRGSEEMSALVDLSDSIRSVWDGYEGEQCKSAFLDYLEQMKNRGIEVTATKPVISERPILKQKGAQDLPTSRSHTQEN